MFMRSASILLLAAVVLGATAPAIDLDLNNGVQGGCSQQIAVGNAADAGPGSLRQAILDVCPGGTITFLDRYVINLQSEIVIDQELSIDGSSVAQNASTAGDSMVQINGGSDNRSFLVNASGDLSIDHLRVSNGTTAGKGGAIQNGGQLSVRNSRFDGNTTGMSSSLGGGAIFNDSGASMMVEGSTFDHNDAMRGSAIFNSGDAEIHNSTFSDNRGSTSEGAIQNRSTLRAIHITVANNGSSSNGFGGLFAFNADTTLINSVIADNLGRSCFLSGGTGLAIALMADSGNCDPQFNDDPQLQPLGANGGATATLAVGSASPALDAGDAEFCLDSDQRGVSRPQGDGCDLGAFELIKRIFADGFDGAATSAPTSGH